MTIVRHRFNQSVSLLGLFVAVWVTASILVMGLGFVLLIVGSEISGSISSPVSDLAYDYVGEVGIWVMETARGSPLPREFNPIAGVLALAIGVVVWMLPVSVAITAWLVRREKRRARALNPH